MSLVVARRFGSSVHLLADSKITDDAAASRYTNGALKAVVLSPVLCVAYAGDAEAALEAVRSVANRSVSNADEVAAVLAGERRADFVVASIAPQRELLRIRAGVVEPGGDSTWVGDQRAFEIFQEFRSNGAPLIGGGVAAALSISRIGPTNVPDDERDEMHRVVSSFVALVESDAVPSVGEFVIHVAEEAEIGLRYMVGSVATAGPRTIPSGIATSVDFGKAERGDFGFTHLVPKQGGIGAFATYFFEGRFGVLFYPTHMRDPWMAADLSQQEFAHAIQQAFGIEMVGVTLDSGPPTAGGQ